MSSRSGSKMPSRAARLVAALVVLSALLPGTGRAAGIVLYIYPSPGSTMASPQTEISIRGAALDAIGRVLVTGSITGVHSGATLEHSDRLGASFVPDQPFQPGEVVVVAAGQSIFGGNGSSAQFTIAVPLQHSIAGITTVTAGTAGTRGSMSWPGVRLPLLTVNKAPRHRSTEDFMLTISAGPGGSGPFIVDGFGNVVWLKPLPNGVSATDLNVVSYKGRPALSWWEGRIDHGQGYGEHVIVDSAYREIMRVRARNGYQADLHEFRVYPNDTAFVVAYNWVTANPFNASSPVPIPVVDCVIQRIDLISRLVLFEWHSLDHVGLDESVLPIPDNQAYDYFHANSVDLEPNGNMLVSARHTDTIYEIDGKTGNIIWRLGGKKSDFTIPAEATFSYQHDARYFAPDTISLFDNSAATPAMDKPYSSGLILHLDRTTRAASVVRRFKHPMGISAGSQGDMQALPNGNLLAGFGGRPYLVEYDRNGNVLYDATMSPGQSYRALRYGWTGTPVTHPRFTITKADGVNAFWVSWNGDTRTARYRLVAGKDFGHLSTIITLPRTGFETVLRTRVRLPIYRIAALDAAGSVLAWSDGRP